MGPRDPHNLPPGSPGIILLSVHMDVTTTVSLYNLSPLIFHHLKVYCAHNGSFVRWTIIYLVLVDQLESLLVATCYGRRESQQYR